MTDARNVLFICSMNKWRSPTAERVFRRHPGVQVRSAGTSRNAKRHVRVEDIWWADLVIVIESKHHSRLRADFRDEMVNKTVHVLEIPDDYQYMDPELIDILTEAVTPLIAQDQ